MLKLKRTPWIFPVVALLVLAGLFLAFFHMHEHGHDHGDCSACRLVQSVLAVLCFILTALWVQAPEDQKSWAPAEVTFLSRIAGPLFQGRAPPVFPSL